MSRMDGSVALVSANVFRPHRRRLAVSLGAVSALAAGLVAALPPVAASAAPIGARLPGEVSVPALGRASTTYVFHAPGPVEYACRLPGHYQYGMHGVVEVVADTQGR